MTDVSLFQVGRRVAFDYPAHNYFGINSMYEPRRLSIESVRDTKLSPLDPTTVELQPLLRRGRWIVTGLDLDKGVERSFYIDAMRSPRVMD